MQGGKALNIKESNLKTNLICLVSMVLIVMGLWIRPLLIAAFVIQSLAVVTCKTKEAFYVLLFTLPFGLIYKYPGLTISFFTFVEFLMAVVILLRYRKVKLSLLLVLALSTIYFAFRMDGNYKAIVKMIAFYVVFWGFIQSYDKKSCHKYVDFFISGLIFSSILGVFKESIPSLLYYYNDMNYTDIEGVQTLRFSGLFDDPNYFSIALISAMVLLIFLKRYMDYSAGKFYFFFILLTALGLLTYSKSFILVYACVLMLEVFLNVHAQNKLQIAFEIIFIMTLIAAVMLGGVGIVNKIISRFHQGQGITTGRVDIWKNYWLVISSDASNKWFGLGLNAPYVAEMASHSIYIETIYYGGFIGLFLYITSWIVMVLSSHKNKLRLRNMVLLGIILVMYAFLCGFLNYALPFYMMFAWMIADIDVKGVSRK